ncbi:defensin-like protein 19 [Henckelia pumila]|uniref:defensin-like protein 19 n=1 Tax=Henckelia pumila TaxID=405737 RepID=UPI003C6E103C
MFQNHGGETYTSEFLIIINLRVNPAICNSYLLSSTSLPCFSFDAESAVVESSICQRRSRTWSGFCGSSNNCDRQCRNSERALHGACHAQFPGFACFCYFNC